MISVWLASGVNIERFCKDINIKVKDGVMTSSIRPAGRTEVKVTVVGLDFNTPDSFVMEYLAKFGTIHSNTVVYSTFDKGPFKGKYNGERIFEVDFSKSNKAMGTYHIIDGCKCRIIYRGNKRTCGRCHNSAPHCPGNAVARNCEEAGGIKVSLKDHMKKLWEEVGIAPSKYEMEDEF